MAFRKPLKNIVALLMFLIAGTAQALLENGPYISIESGVIYLKKYKEDPGEKTEHKPGGILNGAIGYKFNDFFRTELKAYYFRVVGRLQEKWIDGGDTLEIDARYKANLTGGLVNVYIDLPINNTPINPYVGGGMGAIQVKSRLILNKYQVNGVVADVKLFEQFVNQELKKTGRTKFAYQGTIGLIAGITEDLSGLISYRYLATSKIKIFDEKVRTHSFNLGLMYQF